MKIVQINAVYQYSSTGRKTTETHLYLRSRSIDSYVFCTNYVDKNINVFKIGNKFDHLLHAVMSRLLGLQGYFSFFATRKLIKQLSKIKPEIVHLRNLHSNYINLPLLLEYLSSNNIATVVTLHDCWFFTGYCTHYTKIKCNKWLEECNSCPLLQTPNRNMLFDRSQKVYLDKKRLFTSIPRLAVIGNSEWTTMQARKSFFRNANVVERIYNWVDLTTFYPKDSDLIRKELFLDKDDFIVLGIAQLWSKEKGFDIFRAIAKKYDNLKIVLVGAISDQQRKLLSDNVICIGVLRQAKELANYYSIADVFVNPSVQETFGNVSAEALACGTPIIVNNATANPELCGDGCGYVVENNEISTYYHAIDSIMTNGKQHYTKQCRNSAFNKFNMSNNLDQYYAIYEKLSAL